MEQKRVPEPKPMHEIISPVFPRRRFGSAGCDGLAPSAPSAAPSAIRVAVLFRKSRRDQRDFIRAPFLPWLDLISQDVRLEQNKKKGNRRNIMLKAQRFCKKKKRAPSCLGPLLWLCFQEYDDQILAFS